MSFGKYIIGLMLSLLFTWSFKSHAQNITLSGFIEDAETGEKLIGASVYESKSLMGSSSNIYGFYSLTLPAGKHAISFSYVGYQKQSFELDLSEDKVLNIQLQSAIELKTVDIVAEEQEKIEQMTEMSTAEISMQEVKQIPVLLGERDILKTLQLLPGVQSGTEGGSGIYVRGGGPDQNLILLDGVPVYNASHLFGFFSVFNADAISKVKLIKGGFPARYGGRLSSVIDIRMKEGNNKKFHGEGSIGIVSSKLTLEGPIIKDRTSFIISGRRTYIDFLARPLIKRSGQNQGTDLDAAYFFYDVNAKVNHKINDKHRLFLSSYIGRDKGFANFETSYETEDESGSSSFENGLGWGNLTTALRWNALINKKLFANTTLTYSQYFFDVHTGVEDRFQNTAQRDTNLFELGYNSGIEDWAGRTDFDFIPNPNHYIKFGFGNIYHSFNPGISAFNIQSNLPGIALDTSFGSQLVYAHEYHAYIEDEFRLGAAIKVNAGLQYSGFWSRKTHYPSLQPRISGRLMLDDKSSLKASFSRMVQFIHLLTNSTVGLPTDLWVPSTSNIPPESSNQIALGYARSLAKGFELSLEAYYKDMQNLIEYEEGANFFELSGNWDDKVEVGRGTAYGAEFLLRKKYGKLNGWVGYTLSWTNRQFANLNFGEVFPYRYDRRHDLALVMSYAFTENIDAGLTWVYGTGNAISLASSRYGSLSSNPFVLPLGTQDIEFYRSRNSFRMAAYHRLDLGVNFRKEKRWGERTWSIGAYNAYNRRNPFFLFFDRNEVGDPVVKQVSLFPIIPSVSYAFKF